MSSIQLSSNNLGQVLFAAHNVISDCRMLACDGARKLVQKSIAQLIATIAKHDLPDNRWPALFQFLEQLVRSDNATHREVTACLLYVLPARHTQFVQPVLFSRDGLLLLLLLLLLQSFNGLFF